MSINESQINYEEIFLPNRIVNLYKHQLKIREFNQDAFDELKQRLLTISRSLGLTNVPQADQILEIVDFLKAQYSDFSLEEIAYAFQLYAAGKIDIPDKTESFNKFHMRFVGSVLNAYRKIRTAELAKDDQRRLDEKELEKIKKQRVKTYAEKQKDKTEKALEAYNSMLGIVQRDRILPRTGLWLDVYDHLLAINIGQPTAAEKRAMMIEVKERLKSQQETEIYQLKKKGASTLNYVFRWQKEDEIIQECKQQIVKNYFSQLIKELQSANSQDK